MPFVVMNGKEIMPVNKEFELMKAVIEAAKRIHHWHDAMEDGSGMIVSSEGVRDLWGALSDLEEYQKNMANRTAKKHAEDLLTTLIETCKYQLRVLGEFNNIDYTEIQMLAGKIAAISTKLNYEKENTGKNN